MSSDPYSNWPSIGIVGRDYNQPYFRIVERSTMSKSKFIVMNAHFSTLAGMADDGEAAATIATDLAADNPGRPFNVYQLVEQKYAEPPVKVRPAVVTKDIATLEAEKAVAAVDVEPRDK